MVVRSATVDNDADRIDRLFHALADPTRRDIVRLVLTSERSVSALAQRYPMSFAAVQKHVAVLERAELVHKRRSGREQLVRGDIDAVRTATRLLDWYEAVWRRRIQQMEKILTENDTADEAATRVQAPKRTRKEETK